jgi:hypothetical protein
MHIDTNYKQESIIPLKSTKRERRKSIILLEGSQALPARPSDKDKMKVKILSCKNLKLEAEIMEF